MSNLNKSTLSLPSHRRQFVDFRVVVYRLSIPKVGPKGSTDIDINGVSTDMNSILGSDFSDYLYQIVQQQLNSQNDPTIFQSFLKKLYDGIASFIGSETDPVNVAELESNGVFQQIDITPLVLTVENSLSREDANRCELTILDPEFSDFSNININNHRTNASAFVPYNQRSNNQSAIRSFDYLKGFQFREFDLVRVFIYSKFEQKPSEHILDINDSFHFSGITSLNYFDYAMTPAFTGLVNTISSNNKSNSVATVKASCIGLARMFMQSVAISSKSLVDVIQNSGSILSLTQSSDQLNVLTSTFSNKSCDEIMTIIFGSYLFPAFIQDGNGSPVIAVPNISMLIRAMFTQSYVIAPNQIPTPNSTDPIIGYNLIPMLPTVILLHLLKLKYREPIMSFDDRLNSFQDYVHSDSFSPFPTLTARSKFDNLLLPYLNRVRDSFSSYSAEYRSPMEVFQDVKEATYMEFFEDRTGQFHFRFPRYNLGDIVHRIDINEVTETVYTRDDSAVSSAVIAQPMMQYVGAVTNVPPQLFTDRFSVLRYGFRKPNTVENPNCTEPVFSAAFATFLRDYSAGKNSRRATVTKTGDVILNVGDQVLFLRGANSGSIESAQAQSTSVYIGYVAGIRETISVSGEYDQHLDLDFVRRAGVIGGEGSDPQYTINASVWDMLALDGSHGTVSAAFNTNKFIPIAGFGDVLHGVSVSDWMINVKVAKGLVKKAFFRSVSDPTVLASIAATHDSSQNTHNSALLQSGGKAPLDTGSIQACIASLGTQIADRKIYLGVSAQNAIVYGKIRAAVNKGSDTIKSARTNNLSNLKGSSSFSRSIFVDVRNSIFGIASAEATSISKPGSKVTIQVNTSTGKTPVVVPLQFNNDAVTQFSFQGLIHNVDSYIGGGFERDFKSIFSPSSSQFKTPVTKDDVSLSLQLLDTLDGVLKLAIDRSNEVVTSDTVIQTLTDEISKQRSAMSKSAASALQASIASSLVAAPTQGTVLNSLTVANSNLDTSNPDSVIPSVSTITGTSEPVNVPPVPLKP